MLESWWVARPSHRAQHASTAVEARGLRPGSSGLWVGRKAACAPKHERTVQAELHRSPTAQLWPCSHCPPGSSRLRAAGWRLRGRRPRDPALRKPYRKSRAQSPCLTPQGFLTPQSGHGMGQGPLHGMGQGPRSPPATSYGPVSCRLLAASPLRCHLLSMLHKARPLS